ncbi:MAG: hypothetical protein KatS3mg057_1451 [Herpetosiphonaceae bacterium]|nr:MAG: hypothetical protein KatS3mg057_1451 [Herpetosiphonaceae bacterium]
MPNFLPSPSTPFVDREAELAQVTRLLADPACRMLTLVGPSGIGKTRLAFQAASTLGEGFPDGVIYVSLASISAPDLVAPALGIALGLSFYGVPEPAEALFNHLRDRTLLLVLDEVDHVASGSALLGDLLLAAPGIKILATSRDPVGLEQEQLFSVAGMAVPQSDNISRDDPPAIVKLFLQSARRAGARFRPSQRDWSAIARTCRLAAGIPLAIELAAGWTRTLSCAEIASRFQRITQEMTATSAGQDHQQILRAVIDESWSLLSWEEQSVLMKLVVFRGGFRREAAPRATGATLQLLSTLVDVSLLHYTAAGHYYLHEAVRQDLQERLNRFPEEQEKVHHLHCGYYADFLQYQEKLLRGAQQQEALDEIGEKIDNVRLAWRWAVEMGSTTQIKKCMSALFSFYEMRGWFKEGEEAFRRAAEALGGRHRPGTRAAVDPVVLGRLLVFHARFAQALGRDKQAAELCAKARPLLESAAAMLRQQGDKAALAAILRDMVWAGLLLGDHIREAAQESLALAVEIGDDWSRAASLALLADSARRSGDDREALRLYAESSALFSTAGDRWMLAWTLLQRAVVADRLGDQAESRRLCAESATLYQEMGVAHLPHCDTAAGS